MPDQPIDEWVPFDIEKHAEQPLPPEKRYVLVQTAEIREHVRWLPPAVAVGYLKFAAGDHDSPYFVIPGVGGTVLFWRDCLGDEFKAPLWDSGQKRREENHHA